MPIYYATRSRWKGFMWGTLAGFAEIFGGLIGYIIINSGVRSWASASESVWRVADTTSALETTCLFIHESSFQ